MSFLKIKDPAKRDQLVQEYLNTRKQLFEESIAEQFGDNSRQRSLEKMFKPITTGIAKSQKELKEAIQESAKSTTKALEYIQYLPAISSAQVPLSIESQDEPDLQLSSEGSTTSLGPIASQFLSRFANADKDLVDRIYGLRTGVKAGEWYIGSKPTRINEDNIIVGDKEYEGTEGLWELLTTNKKPDTSRYTKEDLINYKNILLETSALKRDYKQEENHPRQSKGEKWTEFLRPIWKELYPVPHPKTGKGTSSTVKENVGVIFLPRNPDALLERLEVLLASRKAGNTGVSNEITAVLDELLRQNIIDLEIYKKLNLVKNDN